MVQTILTDNEKLEIAVIADVHSRTTSFGAIIYLILPKTSIAAQAMAMIQALASRDPNSVIKHLLEVARKGADKFMEQFYVNYGHKSIGDCGNILIAYEGVSMLATKAFQDSQLYAGQEASTRYIDFSNQMLLAPNDTYVSNRKGPLLPTSSANDVVTAAQGIQENWREFYVKYLPVVHDYLKDAYPYESFDYTEVLKKNPKENTELAWKKLLKSRAFDIMRGFLPAGASTYFTWWTSISHCGDHLSWLRTHVLPEAAELAQLTEEMLKEVLPSSFDRQVHPVREEYKKNWYNRQYYLDCTEPSYFECVAHYTTALTKQYKEAVLARPQGVDLPWQIGEAINVFWADLIDFGSFRDLQRHRAIVQRMPLLTAKYGMHEWYLNNLPPHIRESAVEFIGAQLLLISREEERGMDKYAIQYMLPMGMKVPTRLYGSLSKMMYLIELRCQKTVHPTLHENTFRFASSLRDQLAEMFGCRAEEIPMYIDDAVGELTIKRGTQDIVKKEN